MNQVIDQERSKRKNEVYEKEDEALIQEGGYVSPVPHIWDDVLAATVLKRPVLLKGPTGSGKTRFAQSISAFYRQPMQSVNCSVDLDVESLVGFKTIVTKNGETHIEFVEGPVVKAMRRGHILYIDEINMAKPETLPILHSVLDHRRMFTNPFTGEVIHAHQNFTVIAAINEGYVGTSPMNEALKNRFVSYSIPYLDGGQLKILLQEMFPDADEKQLAACLAIHEDLKKQVINGLLSDEAASVRSLIDALALSSLMPLSRSVRYSIAEKLEDPLEQKLVMELAATWIPRDMEKGLYEN